MFYIFRS